MKVIHLCNSFSPLSETFIYDYITELERQGIENYVLTYNRINEKDRPFDKVILYKPKKDLIWLILRFFAFFNNSQDKFFPIFRREIKRIVKQVKPDIIHAHFGPMGVLISTTAKKLKIPLIVTFYGYDASSLIKEDFWIKEYQKLWKGASGITVLSKNMKDVLINIGCPENKITIVHLSRALDNILLKDLPKSIKNFISVGRLTEKKGHLDTLNAFKSIFQENPNIHLTIIGDGALKETLQKFIDDNNLNSNVKLLGAVNNKYTLNELYKSDAFILCSKTAENGDMEGTPTVLVEAQVIGLPCITTYHAGIPEMIPQENHKFLAEEGNVEQIRDCIIKLIETDKEELEEIVKRGRKKIKQDFSIEKEVKKLKHIYYEGLSDAK